MNLTVIGQQLVKPVWEYPYQQFDLEDGLSQSQVRETFQDSRGFVWIGTKESIERFDGLEFVNFRNDSTYIQDWIGWIKEDNEGNVWFTGRQGLHHYNKEGFRTFRFDSNYRGAAVIQRNGKLGIKMQGEIQDYYELFADTLVQVEFNDYLTNPNRFFHYLYQPFEKDTFFVTSTVDDRTGKDNTKRRISLLINDSIIFDLPRIFHPARPLYNKNKEVYFQSDDTVFQLVNNQLINDFILPPKSVAAVIHQKKGFRIGNDLYVQKDSSEFYQFFSYPYKPSIACETDDGIYAYSEKGFLKVFTDHAFENYPVKKGMPSSVWSILEDEEGDMWFGSLNDKKLVRLDEKDQSYEIFSYEDHKIPNHYSFYPGALKTSKDELWFPAANKLIFIDREKKITEINAPVYNYLFEDDDNILAAGATLDIYQNKKRIKSFSDPDRLEMKRLGFLETIAKDTTNLFWLGSHLGLATWDGEQFKNYFSPEDIHSGVMAIKKDYRNNLWFGTHNGLMFYDYSDSLPRPVEVEKFDKAIKSIEFIDSTYLIMGGAGEVYLLDLQTFYRGDFDVYTFTKEDGFIGEECLQNSCYKDSKGYIWLGTTNGVVKVDPSKLKMYKSPTAPHFSYFSYKEKSEQKEVLHRIPFDENGYAVAANSDNKNFEFRFFTINHHKPKSITYRHRLNKNGKKENWSLPRHPRFVSYNNLPYGNYEFEIKTCLYGKCSEPKSIFLEIKSVSWLELLWVKIGIGVAIIALGLIGILRNRIAKRKEEKAAFQFLKTQKNLALYKVTPHFTSNALTAISNLISKNKNEEARTYIGKFANLYRPLTLNEGKLFRTLKSEIEFIENYIALEKLRFNFEFIPIISPEVNQNIYVPAMVIQSFVSNAVKHGMEMLDKGGWVKLEISQVKDTLTVIISDNGLGRKISQQKAGRFNLGKGIPITNDLFHFLNGAFEGKSKLLPLEDLQNETPVGTKVTLKIFTGYPKEI